MPKVSKKRMDNSKIFEIGDVISGLLYINCYHYIF